MTPDLEVASSCDMQGHEIISSAILDAVAKNAAALMPYFTLGYPDRETSLAILEAMAPYSDLLEVGLPFSDPIADGPTIQRSTQVSLEQGTTTAGALGMLAELRRRGVKTPATLMGYYNPILAYGEDRYVQDAVAAGAHGLIVPDLPLEESGRLEGLAENAGLAFIHFLAPTSSSDRISRVLARARGFIYLISLTGITGARRGLSVDLPGFVARVGQHASVPLVVGFGIGTSTQVAEVAAYADGVIVGSAIIDAVESAANNKPEAAATFVRELSLALSLKNRCQ